MSAWKPIATAPEQVRDLARATEDAYRTPSSRMRLAHGHEMGPPMRLPTYAFWIGDDGKIHDYYEIPDPPQNPGDAEAQEGGDGR